MLCKPFEILISVTLFLKPRDSLVWLQQRLLLFLSRRGTLARQKYPLRLLFTHQWYTSIFPTTSSHALQDRVAEAGISEILSGNIITQHCFHGPYQLWLCRKHGNFFEFVDNCLLRQKLKSDTFPVHGIEKRLENLHCCFSSLKLICFLVIGGYQYSKIVKIRSLPTA